LTIAGLGERRGVSLMPDSSGKALLGWWTD
jgi:hypothetical protein